MMRFIHLSLLTLCLVMLTVHGAHAQSNPGQNIFSLIQGGNQNGAMQALQSALPSGSGVNPSQITQIVQNLAGGNASGQLNPGSAMTLLNGLIGGSVPPQLAQVLSGVANLGNISGVQGLASLLNSGGISQILQQVGAPAQVSQILGTVMGLATGGGGSGTLQQIMQNPASLIQSLSGGNVAALGNAASALSGGQLSGASGASALAGSAASDQLSNPQSTMNQVNQQNAANQQAGQPGSPSGPTNAGGASSGCFIGNPVNPFSSIGPFAADRTGKNQTSGYDHLHKGADIMNKNGSPVPPQPGCKVMMKGDSPLWNLIKVGYTARFDCEGVAEVRYGHLKSCDPVKGVFVTNYDAAPHVHYELLLKNPADGGYYAVDPACAWGQKEYAAGKKCPTISNGGAVDICNEQNRSILIEDARQKMRGFGCPYSVGHCKTSVAYVAGKDPNEPGVIKGNPKCDGSAAGSPDSNPSSPGEDSGHGAPGDSPVTGDGGSDATETQQTVPELNESMATGCCCTTCGPAIKDDHNKRDGLYGIRPYTDQCDGQGRDCAKPTNESEQSAFKTHRDWLVDTFLQQQILPAMMLMTNQMTAVAMTQAAMVGTMLDAKHQLETQRLFQELTAQAHKDYHPSEGMCEIGTNVRSLAASERRSDLGQVAFSQRALQRQLLSGDGASRTGPESDRESRLDQFIKNFCNPKDNGGGLEDLCKGGGAEKERMNKDVDFTRTMDTPLTLDVDFTKPATGDAAKDMEDVMALSSNLYAHEVVPLIGKTVLANDKGLINRDAGPLYLDIRALTAKRSVAQNSFAALAAMKSKGSPEVAPFLKKLVEEMGIPKEEVEKYIGKEPSYFAQMEVLSKKIYQNPVFYTELYDKPVNVERKAAALEAIGLMQDRDIYRSLLRSEAIGSVILERMLERDQEALTNEINDLDAYRGGG